MLTQRTVGFGRMPNVSLVMTDDAPGIWNSWMAVFFSNPLVHRLCYWHIERAWRTQVKEKLAGIGTEENRTSIYDAVGFELGEIVYNRLL